jgi:hypothetical protein
VLSDGRRLRVLVVVDDFSRDGDRQIVAAAGLAAVGEPDWMVLIVVPEEDFTGFVAANGRNPELGRGAHERGCGGGSDSGGGRVDG